MVRRSRGSINARCGRGASVAAQFPHTRFGQGALRVTREVSVQLRFVEQPDPEWIPSVPGRKPRADHRKIGQPLIETQDLITKLNVIPDMPPSVPLTQYGLETSPDGARVRTAFQDFFADPIERPGGARVLAFQAPGVGVGHDRPDFNVVLTNTLNPPLASDFSHNAHRAAQAFMWSRILSTIDRLIDLLKSEPFDMTTGETLWDRTMIYVATDFDRTRLRQNGAAVFGSGHDLNNGFPMLSPMVKSDTGAAIPGR